MSELLRIDILKCVVGCVSVIDSVDEKHFNFLEVV